jgi:hypothetical protein
VLDNSHYVSDTLVSTNAPTVQPIFAFVNRSSTSNSPVQSFTPRTRGRLMDEDFGDVRYETYVHLMPRSLPVVR